MSVIRKVKLNKFVLYVSSIALVLFGVLYSFGEVKAVEYSHLTASAGTIYIPDYTGGAVLFCGDGRSYATGFTLDSVVASELFTYYNSFAEGAVFYVLNPSKDDYLTISYHYSTDYSQCLLVSDLVESDVASELFSFSNIYTSIQGSGIRNISADLQATSNSAIFGIFRPAYYDTVLSDISDYDVIFHTNPTNTASSLWYFKPSVLDAFPYYYSTTGANSQYWASIILYELIFNEPPPLDYVLYYGENPANWGKIFPEIPFVYNVCDYVNNNTHTGVFYSLYNNDTDVLIKSDELFSCSGIVKPSLATILSETDIRIEIQTFNESLELITIAESKVFTIPKYDFTSSGYDNFINYRHKQTENNFDLSITNFNNPPFIYSYYDDLETGRDVDIEVEWNIKDDANISSGEICLVDYDTDIATEFCIDNLDRETTKKDIITLSNPEVESIKYYYLSYINDNSEIIQKSNSFAVVFSLLVDDGFLSSFTQESNLASSWIDEWIYRLLNIFPFNFILSIQKAWSLSETTALSSDLQFLDMSDSEGGITAHFPKEWLGSAADMEIDIFGRDMIANGSQDALDLFANFKKFTKWLQYFLFAFAVFSLSKNIISQISDHKDNTF